MTLGRTSSGSIKIMTDNGTTRAVNCACCSCEYCGEIPPKNPTNDPDFTSKLIGDDPNAFNKVSINYSITIYAEGLGAVSSASASYTADWVDVTPECQSLSRPILKMMSSTGCDDGGLCGNCSIFNFENEPYGIGNVFLVLRENGCLAIGMIEEFQIEGWTAATGGKVNDGWGDPCTDDGTGAITINGVSYPTHKRIVFEGNSAQGYLTINFYRA